MKRSSQLLIEELRRLAESGVPMIEAAAKVSLGYQYVGVLARKNGIKFRRRQIDVYGTKGRNKEICRRYLAGEKQVDLSNEFGITRERVRQIIEKAGLVSETKRHDDFVATVVGAVIRKGLTLTEAAAMFNVSRLSVYHYCRDHGVKPASKTAEEIAELNRLAHEVITGASIQQAAGDRNKAERLRRYLKAKGVKAKGRSRHDDFTKRKELLNKWREAGLSWAECAQKIAEHDGRPIGCQAIMVWARRHMPHLFERAAA